MSKIKKIARNIFIIFVTFFVVFVAILYNGIHINELNTKFFKIEKLYLKLDKKLILNIQNLSILKQNAKHKTNSLQDVERILDFLPVLKIFQEIAIINLDIKSQNFNANFLFQDGIFFTNLPKLIVIAKILNSKNAEILEANFKDFNLKIDGKINLNFKKKSFKFDGNLVFYEVKSAAKIEILKNILKYEIFDAKAKSLQNLMDFLAAFKGLPKTAKDWIYGNVVAKDYKLKNLKGKIDLNTGATFLNQIEGFATAKDLNITFNKLSPSAYAKNADIKLKNGTLFIDLFDAKYQNRDLNGSKMQVQNMFKNLKVQVDLVINSPFDEEIHKILNAYKIFVPITQKSGFAKGKLRLNINPRNKTDIVKPIGEFDFNASVIQIGGANFTSKGGKIIIKNKILNVKNTQISLPNLFDANVNGIFNLKKHYGDLQADFTNFLIKNGDFEILNFKKKLDLKLDFSQKNVVLNIPEFNINLNFENMANNIKIPQLAKIEKYSKLLQNLNIKNGDVVIFSKDFKNLDINLKNCILSNSVFYKNNSTLNKFDGFLKIQKNIDGQINFDNNESKISIKNDKFTLKNLDFLVKNSKNDNLSKNINFALSNSKLILKDFNRTLSFERMDGKITKNSMKISANPQNNAILEINKNSKNFSIKANNIKSEFLNELIGSKVFAKGKFKADINGDLDNFKGVIYTKDTHLKNFVFYHQFLTFLNSIPSIISLNKPDFNVNGMTIKSGELNFEKKGDILELKIINLIGSTSDIIGLGEINLKTGKIDIKLEVFLLKDLSNVVSYIPIFNQILLGSDRAISTIVKIEGNLKEPKFNSQLTNDILQTPFNLLKNILTLPANLVK